MQAFSSTGMARTSSTPTASRSSTTCRSSPQWRPYEHRVLAQVDGKLLPIPINLDTINRLYGLDLTSEQLEAFFAERREKVDEIRTSEDVVVSTVGRELYEKFFRGYTRKQWGVDPSRAQQVRHRRASRRAPTGTTATSPTRSRPCRCTATRACSSGC